MHVASVGAAVVAVHGEVWGCVVNVLLVEKCCFLCQFVTNSIVFFKPLPCV